MPPLVSALVLNYRAPQETVKCVQTLLEQTLGDRLEVIVIDNHSQDDSIGVLRNRIADPRVRIIETPHNGGFGFGYNTGARYARGTYLLCNNPDKRLAADGVERLTAVLRADPSIGILAPKIVHDDGSRRFSIRAEPRPLDIVARRSLLGKICPFLLRRYLLLDRDPEKQQDVDWVVGGCFLMPKDLFQELGGFDERFFLFFEDTDLCRRVRHVGKRVVYYPDVVASDRRRRLSGETFRDLILSKTGWIHFTSALKYFAKWGF